MPHRTDTGRSYSGITEHAAGGLHESVQAAVRRTFASGRVFDVGSGSGALVARLVDAGYDVTASDLETADYQGPAPIIEWDASSNTLPAEPDAFDIVTAVEVLEHVENPRQALRNFLALLKPGGLLVVSTPHVGHPRSRLKFLLTGAPSYFGPRDLERLGHQTIIPDWLLRHHLVTTGYLGIHVFYAGRMTLAPRARWAWRLVSPLVAWAQPDEGVSDEGCITVAMARKPLTRSR